MGTLDSDFIYAMLKEYHNAVLARNIGGSFLDYMHLGILQDGTIKYKVPLSCEISPVPGGAKIVCTYSDTTGNTYTTNGASYLFIRVLASGTYTHELFRVSFPSVTKGAQDILHITATAIVTVG